MSDTSLESRIEALETLVAYQDKTIEDLNAALTAQFTELEQIKRHMARLGDQMQEIGSHPALQPEREPPPPHY